MAKTSQSEDLPSKAASPSKDAVKDKKEKKARIPWTDETDSWILRKMQAKEYKEHSSGGNKLWQVAGLLLLECALFKNI